jgi:TonB family protein
MSSADWRQHKSVEGKMKKSGVASFGFTLILGVSLAIGPAQASGSGETPPTVSTPAVDPSDPIAAYRAYEAAVNAGNLQEAATQAHRAWQLAETKWGDTQANTASLAYKAAWSAALIGKGSDRIDAAQRAVNLAALGKDTYTSDDAKFLLAYAQFLALPNEERANNFEPLSVAARAVEGTWNDVLIIDALINSAYASVGYYRGHKTIDLADRALAAITRLKPDDNTQKAVAYNLRGQGRIFTRRNSDEARADFVQARVLYGPMRRTDDTTWGHLAAWEAAAQAVVHSNVAAGERTGSRISRQSGRPIRLNEAQTRAIYGGDFSACDQVKRKHSVGSSVQYPQGAIHRGIVAGIVVRTDIAPDGTTQNVRLLGAVPGQRFGESAVRGVRTWHYEVPEGTPAKCMFDRDIYLSFSIG